ncbi:LDCC motif putative metal-binding protein [Candidatus Margulisiibacteriota bacterium]
MSKWFKKKLEKLNVFLEKLGEENKKDFGSGRLSCCGLNSNNTKNRELRSKVSNENYYKSQRHYLKNPVNPHN